MKQLTLKQAQKIVDQFNKRVKVGDEVFYYPILSKNHPPTSPKRLKVKFEAWVLGGNTPVVYLEGVGNVAITHCFPVKENELFKKQPTLFKIA